MIVIVSDLNILKYSGAQIPMAGCRISAGFPSPADNYIEQRIDFNDLLIQNPSATFLVKVEGDSMIYSFIPPNALLVVDKSLMPKNGSIVVACVNNEFTVKKFYSSGEGMFLFPSNPRYDVIQLNEGMDFKVWGVVTKIIIDPKDVDDDCLSRL